MSLKLRGEENVPVITVDDVHGKNENILALHIPSGTRLQIAPKYMPENYDHYFEDGPKKDIVIARANLKVIVVHFDPVNNAAKNLKFARNERPGMGQVKFRPPVIRDMGEVLAEYKYPQEFCMQTSKVVAAYPDEVLVLDPRQDEHGWLVTLDQLQTLRHRWLQERSTGELQPIILNFHNEYAWRPGHEDGRNITHQVQIMVDSGSRQIKEIMTVATRQRAFNVSGQSSWGIFVYELQDILPAHLLT